MSKAELAASYAAIILADEDIQPTVSNQDAYSALLTVQTMQADKLQTLIKAANVEDVEPIWATLFAKVRRAMDLVQCGPGHHSQHANHFNRLSKARM